VPANEKLNANSNLPIIGGVLTAIGASICCVGPFVLLALGISGAWISNLTLLEPYRPIFIIAALGLFGWAGWKVYRPVAACEPGTACATPQVRKRRQMIFWITAVLALILVTSSYWIPLMV
jgi:mercuric ion transport protein